MPDLGKSYPSKGRVVNGEKEYIMAESEEGV
jgi:hypothetical protein